MIRRLPYLGLPGVSGALVVFYLGVSGALAFVFSGNAGQPTDVRIAQAQAEATALGQDGGRDAHDNDHEVHAGHDMSAGHARHRQTLLRREYERTVNDYMAPELPLVDFNGNRTTLWSELDTSKPVLLNFIYTTCTTICPVLSATFSQVQQEMGSEILHVRMISITIDPEQDTPRQLRDYAERFRAGPQWQFLTGARDDIVAVQKAFDIYRGSKTNHEPVTFLRAGGAKSWVRIEGIAGAREIINEYHALVSLNE